MIELIESILQRLQLNSTDVVVSNYHEFWYSVKLPSYRIYSVPSFYGRFNCLSTILIMPSLSHDPTAINALIISGRSYTRIAVRSKPIRLNVRLGSNNIGRIVIKSRAILASY